MRYLGIIIGLALGAMLSCYGLQPVSFDALDWNVDNVVNWCWSDNKLCNLANGGYVSSRTECVYPNTVSIILTPHEKVSQTSAEASLLLRGAEDVAWHLSLIDNGKKHFASLALQRNGKVIKPEVYFEQGEDFCWNYKSSYRLNLELVDGKAIGSVSDLDGKLLCRMVADAGETSTFPARLAVHATTLHCAYRDPQATSVQYLQNDYAIPPQHFTANHRYTSPSNASKEFSGRSTGFFHVESDQNGRSWVIDPNGKAIFLFGVEMLTYGGRHCEALGYSPYQRNMDKIYHGNIERWAEHTMERLNQWGFNYSGGCSASLITKIPFSRNLMLGSAFASFGDEYNLTPYRGLVGTALPNPFHPRFAEWCKRRFLEILGSDISNPYLVGYFSDNEMCWNGTSGNLDGSGIFDNALAKPQGHTAKQALIKFLEARYQNQIATFNRQWGLQLENFNGLWNLKQLPHHTEAQLLVKQDFLTLVAETYFSTVRNAIQELDSNHMYLGCRYAGYDSAHERVWRANGKYCDIVTFNQYPMANTRLGRIWVGGMDMVEAFSRIHRWTNRPLLITEWAFLGLDSGLPCEYGAGQRLATQKQRTEHAELFTRMNASLPFMVGHSWYKYGDDPKLGVRKNFPENSNYGLVNDMDEPYSELTSMFARIQADVDELRRTVPAPRSFPDGGAIYRTMSRAGRPSATSKVEKNAMDNGTIRVEYDPEKKRIFYYRKGDKLGWISFMLAYRPNVGNREWREARQISNLKIEPTAGGTAMSFVAKGSLAQGGDFQLESRLLLASEGDQLISEVRSIKNNTQLPLNVTFIYFQTFPTFKPELTVKSTTSMNYRNYGAWCRNDSTYFGVTAELTPLSVYFYSDKQNRLHADAKIPASLQLKPGERWKPTEPTYVFIISGKGDYKTQVEKLASADLK